MLPSNAMISGVEPRRHGRTSCTGQVELREHTSETSKTRHVLRPVAQVTSFYDLNRAQRAFCLSLAGWPNAKNKKNTLLQGLLFPLVAWGILPDPAALADFDSSLLPIHAELDAALTRLASMLDQMEGEKKERKRKRPSKIVMIEGVRYELEEEEDEGGDLLTFLTRPFAEDTKATARPSKQQKKSQPGTVASKKPQHQRKSRVTIVEGQTYEVVEDHSRSESMLQFLLKHMHK